MSQVPTVNENVLCYKHELKNNKIIMRMGKGKLETEGESEWGREGV